MAANTVEFGWRKVLAVAGAAYAAVMAFPGMMLAQAQRMSGDWLQLSPNDAKLPAGSEANPSVTSGADTTTVSIDRRSRYRSRQDSVLGVTALEASRKDKNLHISVSLEDKKLYVVAGQDTVMEAPIAIGSGDRLVFGEKAWTFDTPRGIRTIRGKHEDPKWVPPEWHYAETATAYGLKLAKLSMNKPYPISGGRKIAFQNNEAGIIHPDSGFMFLPLDEEIVFDNTLFIPPVGSENRKIQGALGKYKLDTGAGILLHGTPDKASIGRAATHGCMRLRDEDIEWLYSYVPIGTKVYIY